VVTSISPTPVTAGAAAFTLTVNGTNFVSNSVVQWNGSNRTTTHVSFTRLTAAITAADIASAEMASVTVVGSSLFGNVTSNAVLFTIVAGNPVPTITSLSPTSVTAGPAAFTLTVNGTNFVSNSAVQWNGSNRTTTFMSSTQLTAAITAADIASAGTASVTVLNPSSGGGTSNSVSFTITQSNNSVPVVTSLSPTSVTAGGAAFTLTVNGTKFVSNSTVQWNGSNRTTTFVSSTQLRASIPAGDIAATGSASITVFNPAPGGGVSNSQVLDILTAPSSSFFPRVAVGGGYSTVFTVTNTGSTSASGSLILTDQQGNPLLVNGTLTDSSGTTQPPLPGYSFSLTVPAGGTIFLSATGLTTDSPVTAGWGQLDSTGGSLTAIATNEYVVGSTLQTMVCFIQSQPLQYATIPVDNNSSQSKQTEYAIANPSSQTIAIKLALVAQDGTVVDDTVTLTLVPGQQIARYLWQDLGHTDFKGSLVLRGQDGATFVAVALVEKQGVLTAIPLISGKAPGVPDVIVMLSQKRP
jgi:hypothetical protein